VRLAGKEAHVRFRSDAFEIGLEPVRRTVEVEVSAVPTMTWILPSRSRLSAGQLWVIR